MWRRFTAPIDATLDLTRLRNLAEKLSLPEHWDRLAVRRLLDDLSAAQAGLTAALVAKGDSALSQWRERNQAAHRPHAGISLPALESSGGLSVAKLMLARQPYSERDDQRTRLICCTVSGA